jgi:RHH-type rel operon transcriptional repressor/antitoxin RelB
MNSSKSTLLKNIVVNKMCDMQDYYAAYEVLERIKKGEETTYSADEVRRELGLENCVS